MKTHSQWTDSIKAEGRRGLLVVHVRTDHLTVAWDGGVGGGRVQGRRAASLSVYLLSCLGCLGARPYRIAVPPYGA